MLHVLKGEGGNFVNNYEELLDQLKAGEIDSLTVEKEQFMAFRHVLIQRPDFKHFSGTAYHGGRTIYVYMDEPGI